MKPHRGLLLALLLAPPLAGASGSVAMHGVVFEDRNGNGLHELDERGIAGVAVSNGRAIVRSDAGGGYAIAVDAGDTVFAIKPADREFEMPTDGLRADGLPAFWRHYFPSGSPALRYGGIGRTADTEFEIPLTTARSAPADFDVLVFTDPQPKSMVDVDYYRRDIVAPLRGRQHARLGLSLGDIVSDDLALYPAMNRVTTSLGVPWLHVPGNHDIDADAPRDRDSLLTFRNTFGPDTFAWEEQGAVFIGMDDVVDLPGGTPGYVGGLRPDQFAFLEAYLPGVAKDKLLVLGVHIPLFDTAAPGAAPTFRTADRERLFALLRDFPHVLVLSGHTHNQRHFLHEASDGWRGARPLHEYNVGAACGAFWSGAADAAGIPDATMSDGTPNGYAVLTVKPHGDYALAWHPARDAADAQIGLFAPKVLRRGAYPAWGVYANVYMGFASLDGEGSRVEYRIDGGAWKPMQQVAHADPRLLAENARDDQAEQLRGYDRSVEATPSSHLWRGGLATDLAAGPHRVEVRFFDPWRGEERAETTYRLDGQRF